MSGPVGGRLVSSEVNLFVNLFWKLYVNLLSKCWTESNQIWFVASLYEWGGQEHSYFWPAPQGPWGGVQRSNNNEIQLQSQFKSFLCHILHKYSAMIDV